jgi:hypothetical protein
MSIAGIKRGLPGVFCTGFPLGNPILGVYPGKKVAQEEKPVLY